VLSVYLDMSVTSDNKRTHQVFLNKEKARFAELQSDRERHHREPLGEALARVDRWLEEQFDPTNRGVAIFATVGDDWFEAFQLPVALPNRLELHNHVIISPLSQVVHQHPRYGIVMVDRERLRLISCHMGVVGEDQRVEPDAIDAPHDVQAGGYAHKDYQKRKAEEARQFFREFADEIGRFDQRVRPHHYLLLGTHENVVHFREVLARDVADRIIHTDAAPFTLSGTDVIRTVEHVFTEHAERRAAEALNLLQDRVRQSHFATSGLHDTLVQLQEGKVDRLIVARDLSREGVQCTQCGFYLVRRDGACPYCGGVLRDGVDLVESMIRMAATQSAQVDIVPADNMRDLNGVGALLKF
jgi:peptide subunit release factor 1 (eRF1)